MGASDRRKGNRQRKRLASGRLMTWKGEFIVDVTIVDMSGKGARLRLHERHRLPDMLRLFCDHDDSLWEGRLAWLRQPDMGIEFIRRVDLTSKTPSPSLYNYQYARS